MRLFIAVDLSQNILNKIEEITADFKKHTPPTALKWVETENLHLTVKFIGELQESKLQHLKDLLFQSLCHQAPFEIGVSGLGMYPTKNNPRVIWLGITGEKPLIQIHKTLDQNLAELGIKPEGRPFSPHLTIARVRKNVDSSAVKSIGKTVSQFTVEPLGAISIDQVQLYKSVLTPTGPIYTSLLAVPLNQV